MTLAIANIVRRIVAFLLPGSSSDEENTGPTGADAVRTAHNELENLAEKEFEAVLEEPDVVEDTEAEFFGDPKVEVRLRDTPFDAPQRLVFDLDSPEFEGLLEAFGLDMDSMEELAGETVPVVFVRGNPVVDWPTVLADKRAEEQREAQEEVPEEVVTEDDESDEEDADEAAVENAEHQPSDGLDVGAEADDDGGDDSSKVNVEETTVSASSDKSSEEAATDGGEQNDG